MGKREKESCTYQDYSDDDVEILGSTQGSGAPGILQSTMSSRPAKRYAVVSSARRHLYNYRDQSDAEDGAEDLIASTLGDNYGKDLSDVGVV